MAGRFSAALVSAGPDKSPLKTIILGGPGVGKTWLVSTITGDDGSPIFFLPVEEGAKGLCPDARPAGFRNERGTWLAPRSLAELLDALDTFLLEVNLPVDVQTPTGPVKRRPYRHLGVDSLSGIERLVHEAACQAEGVQHMEGADYARIWNAAIPLWLTVQAKLDEIRRSGVHIWLTAHATEAFRASETTGETYRKADLLLAGKSQMLDQVRNLWRAWADNVWYVTHDVEVAGSKKGRRSIAKLHGRILVTRETGSVYAKTRLSIPASLPATWRDLQQAILGRVPDRSERVRKDIAAIAAQLAPQDRAELERDLAAAKTSTQLASVLQRAEGMRAVLDEDDAPPAPATSADPADDEPASARPAATAKTSAAPSYTNGAAAS